PYAPALGRFFGEDPIGFDSGDGNFYRYAHNNPTNDTDPSGLAPGSREIRLPWEGGTKGKNDLANKKIVELTGEIGPDKPPLLDNDGNYYILGKHIFKAEYPEEVGGKGTEYQLRHFRFTNFAELVAGVKNTLARATKPGGKLKVLELSCHS